MAILGIRIQNEDRLRFVESSGPHSAGEMLTVVIDEGAPRQARVVIAEGQLLTREVEIAGRVVDAPADDASNPPTDPRLGTIGRVASAGKGQRRDLTIPPQPGPRIGQPLDTPQGTGIVIRLETQSGLAVVRLDSGDEIGLSDQPSAGSGGG